MPLMTSFYCLQFNCSILMEVGQIFCDTFSNVSKNHDPSPLEEQKSNKMKYDTQTKMVSYDLRHIRKNPHMTPDCDLCELPPTIDLRLTFYQYDL